MEKYFGESTPKLGFGLMRLPRLADDPKTIDVEQTAKMVDMFLEAGLTYFDTAFVYEGSEEAIRKALIERHPRDSFTLATKLNVMAAKTAEEARKEFDTSLERTGAGYFDYYLLHAMGSRNYDSYKEFGLFDYVRQLKADGKIRHWGFSFHDTPEMLDKILTENPDAEFVQLQINYADWDNPSVQSGACYAMARKHGKSIVIMEPVKGGTLANPPAPVAEVFKAADPDASYASWAIRFAASHDGILTVLSGMSNIAQMEDNLSYMKDFKPLSPEEEAVVVKAQEALASIESIPCTACHYCTGGCPMSIPIPEIFSAMNTNMIYGNLDGAKGRYKMVCRDSKASDCIQCGQCETQCPQHIEIIEELKKCAEILED